MHPISKLVDCQIVGHDRPKIHSNGVFVLFVIFLAISLIFALVPPVLAERFPSQGTFEGVYHQNIAGVGRFEEYHVSPELTKQLAPYDGKYISLEVLSVSQNSNPGPACIEKIGKIKELPPAPIKIEIKTVTPGSGGPKTFDIIYMFRNVGPKRIEFDVDPITIEIDRFRQVDRPDEINRFFGFGYTNRQLAYGGEHEQSWNFIHPMEPGERTHFYTHRVLLQPGDSVPLAWHGVENEGGKCEFCVSAECLGPDDKPIPIRAWKSLDLPLAQDKPMAAGMSIEAQVTREDEWMTVKGRLIGNAERPSHIFVQPHFRGVFLPGLAQLLDKHSDNLKLELDWQDPGDPWICKEVNQDGLPFEFRLRQVDPFANVQESQIDFWTVTENGLEKIAVAKNLPERTLPTPSEWGKSENGCRMRLMLPKDRWKSDERVRFFLQAESEDRNLILWIEREGISIKVDGVKTSEGLYALLADHCIINFPLHSEATIKQLNLKPGKHVLEVAITGLGGEYIPSGNIKIPKFKGTLVAKAEFTVE